MLLDGGLIVFTIDGYRIMLGLGGVEECPDGIVLAS